MVDLQISVSFWLIATSTPSSFQELHAVPLSLEEEEDVMCAIGRVLSSLTNVADLNAALERLLKPSHDVIEALVRSHF